jgi:hypothetical protein
MNRRDFLASGLGTVAAGAAAEGMLMAAEPGGQASPAGETGRITPHPRDIKICVKPVMADLIHSAAWQGPCRPTAVTPEAEKAGAERRFADWCKQLKASGLGRAEDVRLLEPAHVTFSESWVIKPDQVAKLAADSRETDAYFVIASGNARCAYEIGNMFHKPILLDGLNCRNISIAGYTLAKGNEVFITGEDLDFKKLLSLLRARKVFRQTKVLYPTN